MRFRLTSIFYAVALIGSAIVVLGPGGIVAAVIVLFLWTYVLANVPGPSRLASVMATTVLVLCLLSCTWPFVFALYTFRNAAQCDRCERNMRQIALALECYEAQYGCFPPAYVADEDGKPMHSWRVLILNEFCEVSLYCRYDFSEPWDGPNNRQLASYTPSVYRCPVHSGGHDGGETAYVAVVGPDTLWPGPEGRKRSEITDDLANTIAVVEAPDAGIHWMEPRDLTVAEFLQRHTSGNASSVRRAHRRDNYLYFTRGWNVATFDYDHDRALSASCSKEALSALLTVNGDEEIASDWHTLAPRKHWRWGRIVAIVVFLLLCIIPAARSRGRQNESLPEAGN
jgi:hypothetical protein